LTVDEAIRSIEIGRFGTGDAHPADGPSSWLSGLLEVLAMLKIVIGLVLIAHGIGHSIGILGAFKIAAVNPAWQGDSWILSNVAGDTIAQAIGTTLWLIAMIGFVALGLVVFGWLPAAWWQPLAIASSVASLLGVLLFPMAFPTFSTIGAIVVDVAVLAAVWRGWVPADLSV
jgi:multisubunit Na+/H+ antiporter MnhC subunit